MEYFFDPKVKNEVITRINQLTPQSTGFWGKMNVTQMMAHNTEVFLVALGKKQLPSGFFEKLKGKLIKRFVTNSTPYPKNTPTVKSYIVLGEKNFEEEQQKLIRVVEEYFDLGPQQAEKIKHPTMGKLTHVEWSNAVYKHLNHHLVQFGV